MFATAPSEIVAPRLLRHAWVVAGAVLAVFGSVGCAAAATNEDGHTETAASDITTDAGADGGDPFAGLEGLRDADLKQALHDRVKNHRALGYDKARAAIFKTGLTPTPKLECIYTGRLVDPNGTTTPSDFNTEHSWPQSLGASREPARSDLHHLFPVDERMNSSRGNHRYGDVTCLTDRGSIPEASTCAFEQGGSALGKTIDGEVAFEVRKAKRGDVARAQFYFSIRYLLPIGSSAEATLREWHDDDTVDEQERFRNGAIERLQNNRNPFVDHAELVARISDF